MSLQIGVISLGCSKNRIDSETMMGLLTKAGHRLVSAPNEADVLIVNTCGFIESAKQESIDTILEMAEHKTGKCRLLVMTGCLSQRYADELSKELPEVDIFAGVGQYDKLPEAIEAAYERTLSVQPLPKSGLKLCLPAEDFFETPRVLTTPFYTAYIKISDGCDNRCSYCAIPLIRGNYRSRTMEDILREATELSERGVKELVLVAQDTSRYQDGEMFLSELLEKICAIPEIHWVRVLYLYPNHVNLSLLQIMMRLPKVCRYLDLPIQHINGEILNSMNRKGSPESIKQLFREARSMGFTLRTTLIVGYPGETQEQFEELMSFVAETKFERLGAFAYSIEDDTPASRMECQIDEDTKLERLDAVMSLQKAISLERNKERIGERCEVLIEGRLEAFENIYYGRSKREAPEIDGIIRFSGPDGLLAGEFVFVRITKAETYDLIGEYDA